MIPPATRRREHLGSRLPECFPALVRLPKWLTIPAVLMMYLGPLYALDGLLGNNTGPRAHSILEGLLVGLAGYGLGQLVVQSRQGRDR